MAKYGNRDNYRVGFRGWADLGDGGGWRTPLLLSVIRHPAPLYYFEISNFGDGTLKFSKGAFDALVGEGGGMSARQKKTQAFVQNFQ